MWLLRNALCNTSVLTDQNLEAHGSHALTSIAASGSATIGRSFGHTLRRAVSIRHSTRYSRNTRGNSRPISLTHNRHSASHLPEDMASNRYSGTFVDLRPNSSYDAETASNRSSIISSSSVSTISSSNLTPSALSGYMNNTDRPHHLSAVQRVGGADSPEQHTSSPYYYTDSSSSSSSSLRAAGGKSPLPPMGKSPVPELNKALLPPPSSSREAGLTTPSPNPVPDEAFSTSSLDSNSLGETLQYYDTPV